MRHAEATGQEPDAPLTEKGRAQSRELCEFITKFFKIKRVISSPLDRALKTIEDMSVGTETNPLLKECYLIGEVPDEVAESEESGLQRGLQVVNSIDDDSFTLLVTHGNMVKLFLQHFGKTSVDLDQIYRPDLYMITIDGDDYKVDHLYGPEGPIEIPERPSARAILLNSSRESIFMFQLEDKQMASHNKTRRLWITPGGGVDPGEALQIALQRELFEELALNPADYRVLGHLWISPKPMVWKGKPYNFIDNLFVVQLEAYANETFNFQNQTEEEQTVLKQFKWIPIKNLPSFPERIVPEQIRDLCSLNLDNLPPTSFISEEV